MLEEFKQSGLKVFLLTNSLWDYTQVVMNYLHSKKAGDDLDLAWADYFDLIIVGGNKPSFLLDERYSMPSSARGIITHCTLHSLCEALALNAGHLR